MEAGIQELKKDLNAYMRRVKAGEIIIITERGKPVGRIVPLQQSTETKIRDLEKAGIIAWNGEKLKPIQSVGKLIGTKTIAELVIEDRE
jgi:prevent-host-death family protein